MKLKYEGTGIVGVPDAGEVAHGEIIELADSVARALLEEQPQNWSLHASAKASGGAGKAKSKD